MKKVLLPLAAMLLGAGAAQAGANVYASALKAENGKITFVLNDAADKVVLNVIKDGAVIATADLGAGVKGVNSVNVPSVAVEAGQYEWSLTASGAAHADVIQVTDGTDANLQLSSGRGIAVDMFPSSPAFGNVYAVSPATPRNEGARTACGLYAFDAALTPLNADPYTGGITWEEGNSNPNNLTVAENGQVFICSWGDAQGGVYVADPADLGAAWAPAFADGERDASGLVTIGGTAVHGSVQDVAVYGTGDARMMYTSDEDMHGTNGDIMVYNIGTLASPWDKAPTADWGHPEGYVNGNHRLESDQRGGLWLGQYRWNESAANACVYHLNKDGQLDFQTGDKSVFLGSYPAGTIAANADGSLLACVGLADGTGFVVAKATYTAEGVPSLEKLCEYSYSGYGNRPMAAAFDAANNLYIMFNNADSEGGIGVFAIPTEKNEFTTPAAAKIALGGAGVESVAADAAGYTFEDGIIAAEAGVAVYTAAGVKVAEGASVDTKALAAGVYVVRAGGAAFKITK